MRSARRLLPLALAVVLAGCVSWPLGRAARTLDRADSLLAAGEYAGALALYAEFLAAYPGHGETDRARVTHATVTALLTTQAEADRLRAELAQAREALAARQRVLAERQAELDRLVAETERLRADLEELKRIDLLLERRRR